MGPLSLNFMHTYCIDRLHCAVVVNLLPLKPLSRIVMMAEGPVMDSVINSRQAVAHALTTVKLVRTICQPKADYIDYAVYIHSDSFHTVCTRHHNPFSISQLTVKAASAF